jgi:hypothetical protein
MKTDCGVLWSLVSRLTDHAVCGAEHEIRRWYMADAGLLGLLGLLRLALHVGEAKTKG